MTATPTTQSQQAGRLSRHNGKLITLAVSATTIGALWIPALAETGWRIPR